MVVRLLAALTLTFAATPALADWQAAETEHFIIYSESSTAEIEKLADRVESYDKLMRMATNIPADTEAVKVRIYEVAGMGYIEDALGAGNSGVAGFYDSNVLGPFLVTPRKIQVEDIYFTPELVLNHEYAHHFMLQYFPAIYPGWYVEGFAELIGSSKRLEDGRIGYGMPAKHRGNDIAANWVPLQELLVNERVRNLDNYGQGWALTHFLTFDSKRAELLRRYLAALSAGKSFKEAAQVFGDLDTLNREARRYVTDGSFAYKPVKVEIARPVIRSMRRVGAGETALIPETIALRDDDLTLIKKPAWRERERKLREANLKRIRDKAARYANDPFAAYLLAEAEMAAGNLPESDAAVDRLLVLQPTSVRAMARKSLNLSLSASKLQAATRAAKASEARRLAVRANRADPNDPMPMIAFFESFRLAGQKPPQIAIDGLMQAATQLPRDVATRQLLVDQLAAEGRYAEAIAWLLPIANSPHDSPRRDSAREQLGKLQALAAQRGA